MLTPEVREFLTHGTRTAKLGFVAADGRPLFIPLQAVISRILPGVFDPTAPPNLPP